MPKNVRAVSLRFTGPAVVALGSARAFCEKTPKNQPWHAACFRGGVVLKTAPKSSTRAFTLMELMTVVVIIGVLAALATYGVRRYVLSAKKAEAVAMLTQIRAAEEAYRDETFQYLGGSNFDVWHPTTNPGDGKRSWDVTTANAQTTFFTQLGVRSDGPVVYSYAVAAGTGGNLPSIPGSRTFNFAAPTGPYYIAMAKADLNGDGLFTYALTHSDSSEIAVEDDTY